MYEGGWLDLLGRWPARAWERYPTRAARGAFVATRRKLPVLDTVVTDDGVECVFCVPRGGRAIGRVGAQVRCRRRLHRRPAIVACPPRRLRVRRSRLPRTNAGPAARVRRSRLPPAAACPIWTDCGAVRSGGLYKPHPCGCSRRARACEYKACDHHRVRVLRLCAAPGHGTPARRRSPRMSGRAGKPVRQGSAELRIRHGNYSNFDSKN